MDMQGEENLGMAMTFTLVTHLRERLSAIMREREERDRHEAAEKERKALEVSAVLNPRLRPIERLWSRRRKRELVEHL